VPESAEDVKVGELPATIERKSLMQSSPSKQGAESRWSNNQTPSMKVLGKTPTGKVSKQRNVLPDTSTDVVETSKHNNEFKRPSTNNQRRDAY
jgi:hypothetical protein